MASKNRFDFFQTESRVTLVVLRKGVELETCKVSYTDGVLSVKAKDEVIWSGVLAHPVDASKISVRCTPSKVEIEMPKATSVRWAGLTAETQASSGEQTSFAKRNWDAIEKQAVQEDEEEKLEGDAAVNRMFQKIYSDANDDVRKAMMKSYSESGGTVLSTNWNEVKEKKVDVKAPESMEYKPWEK